MMGVLSNGPFRLRSNRSALFGRDFTLFKMNADGTTQTIFISLNELPALMELIQGQCEVNRITESLTKKSK